jgi:tripartite-type tricarboxylate transporter receptor subunit TctC
MRHFIASTFAVGVIVLGAGAACGQSYPNKPIRIVTTEPAGAADIATRLIAPGLTGSLGQQVIVDNRGGAGSVARNRKRGQGAARWVRLAASRQPRLADAVHAKPCALGYGERLCADYPRGDFA